GQVFIPNEPGDLLQGHLGVGGGEAARGDLPHGNRGFQGVDVDDVDGGVRRGPVGGRDPRHVAVHDQDDVGLGQCRVLFGGGELVAAVQRVVAGEVDTEGGRLQHRNREQLGQLD